MSDTKGETSGKATTVEFDTYSQSPNDGHVFIAPGILAKALLANPEALRAVLAALGHVEEVEARVVDGLKKRATEAEARLPHLEKAAELLRIINDNTRKGKHFWSQRFIDWDDRDQALAAPTAESGKNSVSDDAKDQLSSAAATCDGVAPSRGEIGAPSGAVEATAGEAETREWLVCSACKAKRFVDRATFVCRQCLGIQCEPAPVAEAADFSNEQRDAAALDALRVLIGNVLAYAGELPAMVSLPSPKDIDWSELIHHVGHIEYELKEIQEVVRMKREREATR